MYINLLLLEKVMQSTRTKIKLVPNKVKFQIKTREESRITAIANTQILIHREENVYRIFKKACTLDVQLCDISSLKKNKHSVLIALLHIPYRNNFPKNRTCPYKVHSSFPFVRFDPSIIPHEI